MNEENRDPDEHPVISLLIKHGLDDEDRVKALRVGSNIVTGLIYFKTVLIVAGLLGTSVSAILGAILFGLQLAERSG